MIFETISPQDFNKEIYKESSIVIDVRTPEEYLEFWVLPKVDLYMNMHDSNFFEKLWKLDRTKKYFIYCWHANRTGYLLNYMKNIWFEYVVELEWGIDYWKKSGFELIEK
jgi:rhodanese-related sulfurtransferase